MACTRRLIPLTINLALAALIFIFTTIPTATAQQQPTIYTNSYPYSYLGCYNETTELPNTNGARALGDGKVWIGSGYMTAPMCLDFCGGGPGQVYKFAGLEYSRECWCAQFLNGLAARLDDSACALQCDGDATQLCGGPLKLSVYLISSNPSTTNISAIGNSSAMANSSAMPHSSTMATMPAVASKWTTGGTLTLGSGSTSVAVTSWIMLWVAAVMMINRD